MQTLQVVELNESASRSRGLGNGSLEREPLIRPEGIQDGTRPVSRSPSLAPTETSAQRANSTLAITPETEREPLIRRNSAACSTSSTLRSNSTWAVTLATYREGGVSVFFRGLGVCSVRAFVVNAVQWAVYEWTMRLLLHARKHKAAVAI